MDDFRYSNETDNVTDFEKLSYGKVGYKRVQRLRKKAKRKGINVPVLGYELTKPERPRIAFIVVAVVALVIAVGVLVGMGFLFKYLIDVFAVQFQDSGGLMKTLLDPTVFFATAGLSFLPVLLIIMAYLMLLLILLLPVLFAIYCYTFARDMIYLSKCSKEEFAKGSIVSDRIFRLIVTLIVSTVILIAVLILCETQTPKIITGLAYAGAVIVFGSLLALLVFEKSKCGKWFETLDEYKKQNYLAHEKGLRAIKRRIKSDRQFWESMFR